MAPHDDQSTLDEMRSRLHRLFVAGKAAGEYEFVCTLLRVRGMEAPGWDPFIETHRLVDDITALVGTPLMSHTKVRLGLLLYSHLTEVGAMYEILANLAGVVTGEGYVIDPFVKRNKRGEIMFVPTPTKVKALRGKLDAAGRADVSEAIGWFFNPALRNAFAHADYSLHEDKFRAPSALFESDGVWSRQLSLNRVAELVNLTLLFYDAFMAEYSDQRRTYRTNTVIRGRFGPGGSNVPIELLADTEQGLYGFRTPPDA